MDCLAVRCRCLSPSSPYLPPTDVSASPWTGPGWIPPSPVTPATAPPPPHPPPARKELHKKRKEQKKKKPANVFPRLADFPGCKSSVATGARQRRRGGVRCRLTGFFRSRPRGTHGRRNNMTPVKSLFNEARRISPVLAHVSSSPLLLSGLPSSWL